MSDERAVPVEEPVAPESVPPTPAVVAAGKARAHLIDAGQLTRRDRRPPPTVREVALPLLSACAYLADGVMEMQGEIARLQRLVEANAEVSRAMVYALDGEADARERMADALEGMGGAGG